jgi:hypothetical protein
LKNFLDIHPDSPTNSSKNLFVQTKKNKKPAGPNLGYEYDNDILTDSDFFKRIFEKDTYNANQETLIDYYEDISRMIVKQINPLVKSTSSTFRKKTIGILELWWALHS